MCKFGLSFFLKEAKMYYGWEDLYCRGKCTFLCGGDLTVSKLGFLALFDPHDNSIKLGKIVMSVPILQMKKLRCRVIKLYS